MTFDKKNLRQAVLSAMDNLVHQEEFISRGDALRFLRQEVECAEFLERNLLEFHTWGKMHACLDFLDENDFSSLNSWVISALEELDISHVETVSNPTSQQVSVSFSLGKKYFFYARYVTSDCMPESSEAGKSKPGSNNNEEEEESQGYYFESSSDNDDDGGDHDDNDDEDELEDEHEDDEDDDDNEDNEDDDDEDDDDEDDDEDDEDESEPWEHTAYTKVEYDLDVRTSEMKYPVSLVRLSFTTCSTNHINAFLDFFDDSDDDDENDDDENNKNELHGGLDTFITKLMTGNNPLALIRKWADENDTDVEDNDEEYQKFVPSKHRRHADRFCFETFKTCSCSSCDALHDFHIRLNCDMLATLSMHFFSIPPGPLYHNGKVMHSRRVHDLLASLRALTFLLVVSGGSSNMFASNNAFEFLFHCYIQTALGRFVQRPPHYLNEIVGRQLTFDVD